MIKNFFASFSIFALSLSIINVDAISQNKCRWSSASHPKTFLEFHNQNNYPPLTGTLYHNNKPIKELSFNQAQGYGSMTWSYIEKGAQRVYLSGPLVKFRGNYPSLNNLSKGKKDAQFMFVGLGSSLYYSREKFKRDVIFPFRNESGFELIDATEGYFKVGKECSSQFRLR